MSFVSQYLAERAARASAVPEDRPVPYSSGEAAIYSVEYLRRTQGPREGADPALWRAISLD